MEQENKNMPELEKTGAKEKPVKKKIDWKFFTTVGVSALAIALSIASICKKSQPGPAGENGTAGLNGSAGTNGKSAYEIAKAGGYTGSETEWIASLKGQNGNAGKSAFDIAVEGGYTGTQAQWIESLKGTNGKTAYELYVDGVPSGETPLSQSEWIASLSGTNGKSAYDLYLETVPSGETPKTAEEWMNSLGGSGGNNSLESLDEYFEVFDSIQHYDCEFESTVDPYCYHLTNSEDVDRIYNEAVNKRIMLNGSAVDFPVLMKNSNSYNVGDSEHPELVDIDTLINTTTKEKATFDINVFGQNESRYVALHLNVYRTYTMKESIDTFEVYPEDLSSPLEDMSIVIRNDAEFTKINDKYYMIFACDSFGIRYIQEFSEELYKNTVASVIYGIENIVFTSGKDYFTNMPGFNMYEENFIGTKSENSACAKYANTFVSEVNFVNDRLISSKTHFEDYMGVSTDYRGEMGMAGIVSCTFDQEVSVVYKNLGYEFRTELPTGDKWDLAGNYDWVDAGNGVDVIDSTVDHLNLYSSIVYQLVEITNCGFIGIPMIMVF